MTEIKIEKLTQRHLEEWIQARRDIVLGRANLNTESYGDAMLTFATELTKELVKIEDGAERFKDVLAEYRIGLFELDRRSEEVSKHEEEGMRVRAAARRGWFDDLAEEDVDDLAPWEVSRIDDQIVAFYKEATSAPKN